jgi:hypothetical protein
MLPTANLRPTRIWFTVVVGVMLGVLSLAKAAQSERHESSLSILTSISLAPPMLGLRVGNSNPLVTVSLAFTVSVCLADVEYSIACRERSLAEAAKRLEQIYLDDYVKGKAAGSLKVWFPLVTERSEQLRFLREAEERAIKTVAAKLLLEVDQPITSQMHSPGINSPETNVPEQHGRPEGLVRQPNQQLQKWRESASLEARRGTNWSHDWSSRTHSYQPGSALHELVRLGIRKRSGN